jgi:putative ABC transport system permease protein
VPGEYQEANVFVEAEGFAGEEPVRSLIALTDENYFDTYGMGFVEGGNFSEANTAETGAFIINETLRRAIGWESAVGKQVNGGTVVGVVKDFHYRSLEDGIRPILHRYIPPQGPAVHNFISVKLTGGDPRPVLTAIEALWTELDPTRSFGYYFVDDSIAALYSGINNTGKILGYFALLSIVIANLGLLGLSSYTVVQRTKEIGIRKVFGSTVPEVAFLLSRQFLRPVLLANLLAWPVAWFVIRSWLQGFAYHADINWLMFPFGGICILALALVTVSVQSARAASINPVKALRYE